MDIDYCLFIVSNSKAWKRKLKATLEGKVGGVRDGRAYADLRYRRDRRRESGECMDELQGRLELSLADPSSVSWLPCVIFTILSLPVLAADGFCSWKMMFMLAGKDR